MAKFNITAWDVAETLGLERTRTRYDSGDEHDTYYCYTFAGKTFEIVHDYYNCAGGEEADEQAARKVLDGLARLIVID